MMSMSCVVMNPLIASMLPFMVLRLVVAMDMQFDGGGVEI